MTVKDISRLLTIAAIALAIPLSAQATPDSAPPAAKRIGEANARAIALQVAPGTVVESDFEKEDGGWRYSFDIRQGDRIHEVGVDALTGKVVENSDEGTNDKD
ncbi:MAG: peptidase M4 [Alphaproteobacteria bacterium]|nr:peptidase M4 [Alphaproteobacteria bacterium]